MCTMKTFKVIPSGYGASYAVKAAGIVFGKTPTATCAFVDDKGLIIGVSRLAT